MPGLIVAAPADDPLVPDLDPPLEPAQGSHSRQQTLTQRCRYAPVCRIGEDRHEFADMMGTFGDYCAKLRHQPTQRVDQHRALFDQHLAHFVNARRRLLHLCLDRDKAHRWAAHRFANRRGIGRIVFVGAGHRPSLTGPAVGRPEDMFSMEIGVLRRNRKRPPTRTGAAAISAPTSPRAKAVLPARLSLPPRAAAAHPPRQPSRDRSPFRAARRRSRSARARPPRDIGSRPKR